VQVRQARAGRRPETTRQRRGEKFVTVTINGYVLDYEAKQETEAGEGAAKAAAQS